MNTEIAETWNRETRGSPDTFYVRKSEGRREDIGKVPAERSKEQGRSGEVN